MFNIIKFNFILFSGISLIVIASLFTGIEIDKISYKNINIEKLYLKYDKKLNISSSKISILDKDLKTVAKMKTHFTLNYLNGIFTIDVKNFELADTDLEVQGTIFLDLDTIDLEKTSSTVVENLILQFDKKVKKVYARKTFVSFKNNRFDLTFEDPFYDTIDMSNSKVSYLLETNTLKLYLKTQSIFNDSLKDILTRYNINIPIIQYSGKNKLSTNIFIPFSKGDFFIEADVKTKNAILESYGQKFDVADLFLKYNLKKNKLQGNLYLNNYTYNNINLQNAQVDYDVFFNDKISSNISTKSVRLNHKNIDLKLNNLHAHFDDLEMDFKGNITNDNNQINLKFSNKTNFNSKSSLGVIKIDTLKYDNLMDVNQKNITYNLNFDKNTSLSIPELNLNYLKNKNNNTHALTIDNPKKILDAFTFIEYETKNTTKIEIHSKDMNDTVISINNLNLDINSSYFNSDSNETEEFSLPVFPKMQLNYNNSSLKYDSNTLIFDTLDLKTNKNNLILNIKKDTAKIDMTIQNNIIEAHALNLTDKYINNFLGKIFFEGGYVDLNLYAENINFLMGDISFYDTTIKNVTLINNLSTFINTTPAIINPLLALPTLFRMAETGFDTNGYYIKTGNGSFHYSVPLKQLDLFDLFTNGKMSNFNVNSHIDYKTNQIQANIDISFLKDFTEAINYIPVLGYVFLGDDGEIHTSVDITGSLSNPTLETHTVKEGTRGVGNFIQRILTLPLQPFNIETSPKQLEEHNKRVDEMFNN